MIFNSPKSSADLEWFCLQIKAARDRGMPITAEDICHGLEKADYHDFRVAVEYMEEHSMRFLNHPERLAAMKEETPK